MDSEHVSVLFGVAGFILGGGGLGTVVVLAYRMGGWTKELKLLTESLNGDGPWQRKIDSTRKHGDETRKIVEGVKERVAEQAAEQSALCAARGVMLKGIEKKVDVIERRQERKKT